MRQRQYVQTLEAEVEALREENLQLAAKCQALLLQNGDEVEQEGESSGEMWSVQELYGQEFEDFLLFKERELSQAQAEVLQKVGDFTYA